MDDIEVLGEAKDGQEAIEQARALLPDVVLIDISMPQMDGVTAARAIKREHPHMGIVALTMYEEEQYIYDMIRAGATGYLLKDTDSSELTKAIRAIYRVRRGRSDPFEAPAWRRACGRRREAYGRCCVRDSLRFFH